MSQPHPPVTPSLWPVPPAPSFAGWTPPAPKPTAAPKKKAKPSKPTAQS